MASDISSVARLERFLRNHPSINYIRYQWIDYAGILRTRVIPIARCRQLAAQSSGAFAMSPVAMSSTTINEFMPGLIPTGIDHIHPDYSSLRPCLYAPGHASVMCFVSEGIDNAGFGRCPRTLLMAANSMATPHGLELKVGFEVEFRCLKPDGTVLEDCIRGFSTSAGLRNRCFPIIEEILQVLEQSEIEVQQFHTEGSQGMFEISTGPMSPVEAVDAWVYTRETIKTLFSKHDIIATMHPSPTSEHHGIGTHFHLSISPPADSTADAFLAGILTRLPALCAFSLPLAESYKRVSDFASEVGAWVAWGTENRDVPLRKIRPGHWEVRCCDGTANVYLVVAAFISSGMNGIYEGQKLVWKDYWGVPSNENVQRLALSGIQRRLPSSLLESLDALDELDWERLGLHLAAKRYSAIKRHELVSLTKLRDDQRMALLIRHF